MLAGSRCIWLTPGTSQLMPREDCLRCACSGRNPCGYPLPVIQQVLTDRDPNVVQCSATMIAGCAREAGLKKNETWWIDPKEAYIRAHGSLLHLGAETKAGNLKGMYRTEDRIRHPFTLRDGREVEVTAQVDIMHADGVGTARWFECVLVDYKTVSSLAPSKLRYKIAHHVAQLSIQRWLLEQHGNGVTVAQLIFMTHDDRRVVRYRIPDGPPEAQEENEDFPDAVLMTLEETEEYLQTRLPPLVDSLAGQLAPPLTYEEGWFRCRNCDVRRECVAAYGQTIPGLGGKDAGYSRRDTHAGTA